jgi:peptidoglycan/xylan/chitin deacetylase (PgdA/CDA1 family)
MKCIVFFLFTIIMIAVQSYTSFDYRTEITNNYIHTHVPVLCYHNIKENPAKENVFTISEAHFDAQLKLLYDSGYRTISPEQLVQRFTIGHELPTKPVIISFDDAHEEHYSIAKPILEKYGFRGVFFIMTVYINKPNYLTATQIKELAQSGHTIGGHTWNHPMVTSLAGNAWDQQIDKPDLELEKITGKPVKFFAYPNGVWNENAIAELKNRKIKAAFQLMGKESEKEALFTIRRVMVSGLWTPKDMKKQITRIFAKDG